MNTRRGGGGGGSEWRGVLVDELCSYSSLHWVSLFPCMGVESMSMYDSSRSISGKLPSMPNTHTHTHRIQNANNLNSLEETHTDQVMILF